jgi:hypothetical protein
MRLSMSAVKRSSPRRATRPRGRPPKYGRPSRVVAVTLPVAVIAALRRRHQDLGWAIVDLAERSRPGGRVRAAGVATPAELVEVGGGQALIAVAPDQVHDLPGVRMIPLSDTRAFLALEPGRGLADLEVAVLDRIQGLPAGRERRTAQQLVEQLREWRRGGALTFETRSIILVTGRRAPRRR